MKGFYNLMGGAEKKSSGYITEGLILWYDAINNTGTEHSDSLTNWFDLSGNGNHGALTAVTFEANAAVFNGTTSKVVTPYKLPQTGAFTAEILFLSTVAGAQQYLLSQSTATNHYRLQKNTSNYAQLSTAGTGTAGQILATNTLYNISAVRSSDDKVYVNTNLSITRAAAAIDQATALVVGGIAAAATTAGLSGKIMSFRIYTKELTDAERAHNYAVDQLIYPAA